MFLAAVVQLCSSTDRQANWDSAQELIRQAAARGAAFVATPENTNFIGPPAEKLRLAEDLNGVCCTRFAELSRELKIHLLLGSFNEQSDPADRIHNASVLFGPAGERLAVYRKIHLFDVDVSREVSVRESATVRPGKETVVAQTPLGRFGLSVCFDLRFGELYRRLVQQDVEILCVPSAFTLTTGRDHWEPLLRARAIECQCYVIAPGQWGQHNQPDAKESFGHSLIADPWGHILTMVPDGPGIALAEIDLARVVQVRQAIPMGLRRQEDE